MRDFFKYTLASLLSLVLFTTLGIGGLIVLIIAIASRSPDPQVRDKSVLVFDLSMTISDTRSTSSPTRALEQALSDDSDRMTLRSVLKTLDGAAKDPKIVGLYLNGGTGSIVANYATLQEVRVALERFKATGKPIIAYDPDWREKDYYLGSLANTVILNPIGTMEINGLSSQTTFFTGALEKYGVGIQVLRVGKYKSAVEPFLLTRSSAENREQTQKLLSDLWGDYLQVVAKSRKLEPKQLQEMVDNQGGLLMAEEAKSRRLVDRIAYSDEVIAELKQLTDSKESDRSFRQMSLRNYARLVGREEEQKLSKNQVALVYAEGEIVSGQGESGQVGGDRLARQLRQLRLDKEVKAVVLRINSPGGGVTPSDIIAREVMLIRETKPIIVSMGDVAASGGYWIAAPASKIFAEPSTITGSIGVFGLLPNVQRLAQGQGITWDTTKTGKFADSQTILRPKTPQELALQQRKVEQIYDRFITRVAESRKLPKQKVSEIAQGRVWSGQAAKQLGLVDEMGGLEQAIQEAAAQAKLGDDWVLEEYPKFRSLEERLLERLVGESVLATKQPADPLTTELQQAWKEVQSLRNLNDPLGVYARLPFTIRID